MQTITKKQLIEAVENQNERKAIAKQSFAHWCAMYLPHYMTRPSANFHSDMIMDLSNWEFRYMSIVGFRGSAKSSYAGVALVLWAALEGKSKYMILVNETDDVAKISMANIRNEIENNLELIADYPFSARDSVKKTFGMRFSENNIVLANGCRIMTRSRGQKIRGLRHIQYRPDFVVMDDVEEREKVKSKDYRDKTEAWIRNDIIPAIEELKSRLVILGNLLHTDGLMMRLKRNPIFIHREYPLFKGEIDKWENCTWKGKFISQQMLDEQKQKVGFTAWMREYCLKIVPEEGQEVKEEWIQYYDEMPAYKQLSGTGVDLAISKKQTADYTAMTSGTTAYVEGRLKIYIHPNPIEERFSFHETINQIKAIATAHSFHKFWVESVAYQQAAVEELERQGINVQGMKAGTDKRARLRAVASYIQQGVVVFPRKGCEELIDQIVNFGITQHDDLCDSFVYLILGLVNSGLQLPEVHAI